VGHCISYMVKRCESGLSLNVSGHSISESGYTLIVSRRLSIESGVYPSESGLIIKPILLSRAIVFLSRA
jgi:hypothetical protein